MHNPLSSLPEKHTSRLTGHLKISPPFFSASRRHGRLEYPPWWYRGMYRRITTAGQKIAHAGPARIRQAQLHSSTSTHVGLKHRNRGVMVYTACLQSLLSLRDAAEGYL
jgi:hypothetical protein